MELNRDQILKDLECWVKNFDGKVTYFKTLCDALALIMKLSEEKYDIELSYKSLKRDNERLNKNRMELEQKCESLTSESIEKCASAKADTVRKMQERLKAHFDSESDYFRSSHGYIRSVVDQIAKEMLEGEK